jgi:hypothetical protein
MATVASRPASRMARTSRAMTSWRIGYPIFTVSIV